MRGSRGAGPDPWQALGAFALGAKAARHLHGHVHGPGAHEGGFGIGVGGPFGFGGFGGGRPSKAPRGNVRAAILSLLAEEPRNGYQIIQEIEERSGGGWRPSPGAVYPALQQLADEGLIEGEEEGGRRTFRLTDAGRAHAAEHADELAEPWAAMTPAFGENVPDLFKEAAQTGAAVMQVVRSGSPDQVARAGAVLADARRDLYRILAGDAPADGTPDAPAADPEEHP
ncbi:PadR family transcriptional regulator [Actinomadura rayongensis]|uniref:PadR family transcriptional regulator n=1 Tax=Actinomadura rayongensis TaxID=1429076 RepID=A0A6I4WC31_9ACTN|nr:PadR family transcriptional regulator [Actinomadura rayongensis]MXQ66380.1 PadR family transcriptional regulator [Actinomadura rayongensis]